ncbi:MAG TPA: pilus assembly protein TadG-related protein [Caulobacteraceae bacterium]|nr:pilus assembly protein TadG-related protein [Caulobacteraceae bacterium]
MIRNLAGSAARWLTGFGADRRGVIALKFALVLPPIAALTLGAIDLHAVHSIKTKLQDVADSAALAAASELALAVNEEGPKARARSWVQSQFADWADAPAIDVGVEVLPMEGGARAIRVSLDGNRPSFFGNLLPPGGWNLHADATATSVMLTPLCVLAHGKLGQRAIEVTDAGKITAPDCMVHSNKEILVSGGRISAGMVQAVDWARGVITPEPATGAAAIEDPFRNLPLTPGRLCGSIDLVRFTEGRHSIPAGVHCGGYLVEGDAELVLEEGEHWFMLGALTVREDARLTGEDVVLLFDTASNFDFSGNAVVNLDGRKSGPYAGFVMAATRLNVKPFTITSDNVATLLGVIYVPQARLIVEGAEDVARDSAWTVIVARSIELRGAPSLFINADYAGTDVPVPTGVGPREGGSRLVN